MTEKIMVYKRPAFQREDSPADIRVTPVIQETQPFLQTYRTNAWQAYQNLPLPTSKDEEWRRSSLENVSFSELKLIDANTHQVADFPKRLLDQSIAKNKGGQILVTPIRSDVRVDQVINKQGVIFDSLKNAVKAHPEVVEKLLNRLTGQRLGKFGALAGALDFNGVILYIPKGVKIEYPLQSIFWASEGGFIYTQHIFVYLEEGSEVTYVHESSSPEGITRDSIHSGIMDIFVGCDAHLNFVELQSWGENIINFTRENVVVDKNGSIDWIFGALGSRLTKNYSSLNLNGQGSSGKMSGFYFTDNKQHLDHDTQQNHLAPNTTSDLLFKGALLDNSHSIWKGMIYVAPEAQKTDGYQANRNLVLSDKARADSIPGLEILTDDVRCTHGATVGRIDEEQIYYLMSRGLDKKTAERLIVEGFFDPIMQRIPFDGIKERFQKAIKHKMEHIG